MKKTTSVILIISMLLTVLFSIDISADGSTTTVGYLTFTEHGTYCTVTKCSTSASGNIEIPSSVNFNGKSLPVTSIGEWAFSDCSSLTSVTIPDSVTSIGVDAFNGCSSLTSVTIPDSVTSIDEWAFFGCYTLTSITIPDSVTSIGNNAFSGCSRLESITVSDKNTVYHSTGNCLIETGSKTLILGCKNSIIPNDGSVTSIGIGGFYECYRLTSVTIPDSVTSIGVDAFNECKSLTSVTMPDGVTSIGEGAFEGCSCLTSITIPDSVTSIGDGAFAGCRSLTSVTIPSSVTSIGESAFNGCSSLTSVTIPSSVTSIGSHAFYGCSCLTSITIPDSVTSIGESAFYYCYSLKVVLYTGYQTQWSKISFGSYNSNLINAKRIYGTNKYVVINNIAYGIYDSYCIVADVVEDITGYVEIPDEIEYTEIQLPVTAIGDYAFKNCSGITSITIPDSVTSIGTGAFDGCNSLTHNEYKNGYYLGNENKPYLVLMGVTDNTIRLFEAHPDTVAIYDNAFNNCTNLTVVKNIGNVGSIGASAFSGCSSLVYITIPENLTLLGSNAFNGCSGLTNITIPDSVTSIGYSAFSGCNNLTDVTIGNGVTSIGIYAFSNCSSLKSVTIPDSVTSIGYSAFSGCNNLTDVTIGNGVTSIGIYAFSNCSSLKSVTIPDSVTSIGEYAFSGCSNLTGVTIPDSVTSIGDYAFQGCSSLTSVTISDSVTSIGNNAFYKCYSLTSITIPDSVTSIGDFAFDYCSSLKVVQYSGDKTQWSKISIGSNNENLINAARIYGTSKLIDGIVYDICDSYCVVNGTIENLYGKIEIQNEIEYNGVKLPVTSIRDDAFNNCTGITEIVLPENLTYIGIYAFKDCTSLKKVWLPKVVEIDFLAFSGCNAIQYAIYSGTEDELNENVIVYDGNETFTNHLICHIDHSYSDPVITATCTEAGEAIYTCTVCGYTETHEADALGHDFSKYGYDKNNHWLVCTRCGETKDVESHTAENGYCTVCGCETDIRGDINGDRFVNNKDVILLYRYVSSIRETEDGYIYDFNRDGVVNNKDVTALFRYVLTL